MSYHEVIGIIAFIIMMIGKVPYILSIVRGITKPSRVSWWTWTLLGVISFVTYIFSGATGTLWIQAFLIIGPLIIAILSLRYGVGGGSKLDRLIWMGCGAAVVVWVVTQSPELGNYFNLFVDALATAQTVRKAWEMPFTEDLSAWLFSIAGYTLNLFALNVWTFYTASYPVYLVGMATAIVAAILLGRRRVRLREGHESVATTPPAR